MFFLRNLSFNGCGSSSQFKEALPTWMNIGTTTKINSPSVEEEINIEPKNTNGDGPLHRMNQIFPCVTDSIYSSIIH